MNKCVAILFLICFSLNLYAQPKDTSKFKYPILMDSVVVSATRSGWDVNAFIKRVRTDTTFYKAFRSIHVVPFTADNDIRIYDKHSVVKASLKSKTRQNRKNGCRDMDVLVEKTMGDFYNRKKEYNYYTAELYAYLFFTPKPVCGETDAVANYLHDRGKGQLEKSKYQLKQLIFNPGSHIEGIPFMGDKAAIFEPEVAKLYDFHLLSEDYNGMECYVFKAIPKKGESKNVVYNELTTWFRKSDYAIVARDYSLSYHTMLYDFDVRIKARTTIVNSRLLPEKIDYDGNWHVFTKDRERVKFIAQFKY